MTGLKTEQARHEERLNSTAPRTRSYCSLPQIPEREFGPDVGPDRAGLIRRSALKWVNGTVLHYYFFDRPTDGRTVDGEWQPWTTSTEEKDVVRQAFDIWKDVGIGLEFEEVNSRVEAEIRIGFERDDGAWSVIGRDVFRVGTDERTMNFGWDLTRHESEVDTAVHEIGHTVGFPHEHQNPHAGIVWDEEAVYADLAGPPNFWGRDKTYYNIIRKINPDTVQGSSWDPDSIMHYSFDPGLIKEPEQYRTGLEPAAGLSERDREWVKSFYPLLTDHDYTELEPYHSVQLAIAPGEQKNFIIEPHDTRYYEIRTFGVSDTVLVLFEDENGEPRYVTADDDSGENYNSYIRVKLFSGRTYILRIRLYYSDVSGEPTIMVW